MVRLKRIWERFVQHFHVGRTRVLEEEMSRLREENRALVNSILGLAGIPPMRVAARTKICAGIPGTASAGATPVSSSGQDKLRSDNGVITSEETNSQIAPLRRRSWQQLGRVREIEDARTARRERETNTDSFPAPRNVVPRV